VGNYPGSAQAYLLSENQQYYFWYQESVPAGTASRAVQLRRVKGVTYPFGASFEISFSGDPGVFEVDIQTSDTDTEVSYVTIQTVVTVNAEFVARIEMPSFWAKYARAKLAALANPVMITAQVTR